VPHKEIPEILVVMKRITYSGVKVFRFMTEFQFLEVLNLAILWLATP